VPDGHPPTATPAGLHLQPGLDPGRHGADAIISSITQAITPAISQHAASVR
jgi:hypothetical protein